MIKETFVAAGVLLFVCWLVLHFAGCAGAAESVAEATYLGQQLSCVDKYPTRKAIDACRLEVRKRWGIAETARDGGVE